MYSKVQCIESFLEMINDRRDTTKTSVFNKIIFITLKFLLGLLNKTPVYRKQNFENLKNSDLIRLRVAAATMQQSTHVHAHIIYQFKYGIGNSCRL